MHVKSMLLQSEARGEGHYENARARKLCLSRKFLLLSFTYHLFPTTFSHSDLAPHHIGLELKDNLLLAIGRKESKMPASKHMEPTYKMLHQRRKAFSPLHASDRDDRLSCPLICTQTPTSIGMHEWPSKSITKINARLISNLLLGTRAY